MNLIDRSKIEKGVINMFKINMAIKSGEKILVLTDIPTLKEWQIESREKIFDATRRSMLAKTVYEIATETLLDCDASFFPYSSTGRSGAEPNVEVAEVMKKADVIIAITNHSLTHTNAREDGCRSGARIASMPGFIPEMFYPNGPMTPDYNEIVKETRRLSELLTKAVKATIRSKEGTDITFSLKGRRGFASTGILRNKGDWGNLPSGEAYIAPVEGTASGRVVVVKGWCPNLRENMLLTFNGGKVVNIKGGGDVGDWFRELLSLEKEEEKYLSRRNFAEFGIGTNPNAKRSDNPLEAEKIKGTVHIALGDNSHFGGAVNSDIHYDFIIPHPELILNGKAIIKNGQYAY